MSSRIAFDVLVGLHVASAIVGFGGVALSGAYGYTAEHLERRGAMDEARRWFTSPNRAEWALLAVPFFAVAALLAGGRQYEFSHLWVDAALGIWVLAASTVLGVVRPAEAVLRHALTSTPSVSAAAIPDAPGAVAAEVSPAVARAARRLQWGAGTCDVAFVAALCLMIWQPK